MRILWLTWKDKTHPLAGGAEVVASELGKRLVQNGHELIFVTSGYDGAKDSDHIDGYEVIRVGNRYSVYWRAFRYISRHLKEWPDIVIEEVNTIPFFSRFYMKHTRRFLLFHMLCREIWFYQMPVPASWLGFILEPLYLRTLTTDSVITVSNSTRQDLVRHGFSADTISIISEGIQTKPMPALSDVTKYSDPTVVSLGALRPMKRTLDQVKAFEIAAGHLSGLRLKIAGDATDPYGQKVLRYIDMSPFRDRIEYLGKVSHKEKQLLLQKSHVIAVASVKEGWGLIVTEAASQGTPAVVYDVDGLRDSVQDGRTGLIAERNSPEELARKIIQMLSNPDAYTSMQEHAWQWSKEITFEKSYAQFSELIGVRHG